MSYPLGTRSPFLSPCTRQDRRLQHPMTYRPWSELTKYWSPERRAENERAKAKLRAHIRSLQSGVPAGDAPLARDSVPGRGSDVTPRTPV